MNKQPTVTEAKTGAKIPVWKKAALAVMTATGVSLIGAGVNTLASENNTPERPAPAVVPDREPTTTTSTTTTTPEVQIGDPKVVEGTATNGTIDLPDTTASPSSDRLVSNGQEATNYGNGNAVITQSFTEGHVTDNLIPQQPQSGN